MKKTAIALFATFASLSSFASNGLMLSCQSGGEINYSVTVLSESGSAPQIYIAKDGAVILKENVVLEGVEAESSGALGKKSYLRVDYEDDRSGVLKFCENGKEVEVTFDYKECSKTSQNWPNRQSSSVIPNLNCSK